MREKKRQTETETNRKTKTKTSKQANSNRDKQTSKQQQRQTNRQNEDRQTHKQAKRRQTNTQSDKPWVHARLQPTAPNARGFHRNYRAMSMNERRLDGRPRETPSATATASASAPCLRPPLAPPLNPAPSLHFNQNSSISARLLGCTNEANRRHKPIPLRTGLLGLYRIFFFRFSSFFRFFSVFFL